LCSLYEVLDSPFDPDRIILVMPFLRRYDSPRILTVGEAVEFFRQAIKGMQFIHKHHVAHRDGHHRNIMCDATTLYPDGHYPHPVYANRKPNFKGRASHYTRTEYPPKYYWIDFGLSTRHDPESTSPPAETRIWGGDKSVPEFQPEVYKGSYNPFPTDVYYVGNLIKTDFVDKKRGFSFMEPLISDMVANDPDKRPSMDQVVDRFDEIRRSLSKTKLRSRVANKNEPGIVAVFRGSAHFTRSVRYFIKGIPPMPVS